MEPFRMIVMEKDIETGILEKEITSYDIEKNGEIIGGIYAEKADEGYDIVMRLTTDKDLEDWEFVAVFDYYDISEIEEKAKSVEEDDSYFNPVWAIRLEMDEDDEKMEQEIQGIVNIHIEQLQKAYEEIKDKKEDYSEFDEQPHVY
ncbi:hypothetical protein SAMN02745945_01978 [Peptoclostridium litorale DSM 5388]|uniref:Uncharacterized protein n=1 Tax=Peptoclostridium litorale DSM 5388 TaxID=1121324 RepID=A0A069RPY9_PEPLI|nr:DUF6762 family protein [Peptoclostridium litorale]KDR96247.1 hypothetical protein CLIT_4c00840 [Peptoclostridium litorale DSM 5388]SIO14415.1 hypothetical protein SAMN02745945_01978 [Peptoclostridium litorale DSM 5388]